MDDQKDPNQNKNKIEDIEMGDIEPETPEQPSEKPQINNYIKDVKAPEETVAQEPEVNPAAEAPEAPKEEPQTTAPAEEQIPQQQQAQGQTIGQAKMGVDPSAISKPAQQPVAKVKKPANPEARKKAVLGCLGAFGAIMVVFLILSFVFVASAGGSEPSALASLLGVNEGAFVNGLITFIHIIFIMISLVAFVFTMIGLMKAVSAKRGDNYEKKKGLKMSLFAGITLIIILIFWMFVYVYLDSKRVNTGPDVRDPIVTEPEETINLSAPIEVRFDATSVPVDKGKYQITFYEWDFGDDETGTGQIVTHTFEKKGKFDVLLTITKRDKKTGEELEDQYSKPVTVGNQQLSASFKADPQSGEAPLEVTFDASESIDPDGTISRYEWDFDEDGSYDDAEGVEATKTFEKIGIYEVGLRVTSTTEEFSVSKKEIVVEEAQAPEAVITVLDDPGELVSGIGYTFTADGSTSPKGNITDYKWKFSDDNSEATTQTTSHVFMKGGTYQVKLIVTNEEGDEGEAVKTITVGAPKGTPKAKISTQPAMEEGALSLSGNAPLKVVFSAAGTTDSDSNIIDYEWDFENDGNVDAYGETATHTFAQQGTYTVELSVLDADRNVGTATTVVKVEAQGIMATLNSDVVDGSVPVTVNFDAGGSTYPEGQITSYKWNFGDGSSEKLGDAKISHKYTAIGAFTATVSVIGSDNTQSTASVNITVREIPLQACFVSVFEEGPAPLETVFDPGCTTGTVATYFWDFGDGGSSTTAKPTHTFADPGEYTVKLEINDAENTVSTAQLTILVTDE
ncbi:PKD domain-containing protein [Candidatus Peregrinibacteria bacterium]|jgi:PKD repeat protein|nr:PKD domain-containing protein [Candidatus Peregrinibacteria bacterium]MBT7736281.1 PKD domain-containing protein [Candidatus Peregrinibacteria bacterium]